MAAPGSWHSRLLQRLFFAVFIRPIVLVVIGLNVRNRQRLPAGGPAVLVANHNSHLDTVVLMTLFPARQLARLRPAAAADYFMGNAFMAWFSTKIMGILPVRRGGGGKGKPLAVVDAALADGDIVILFPEGSRGDPERRQSFKKGIAHLARDHPDVPVIPLFMHGLGKALPKGDFLLVPFFCDVFVGEPLRFTPNIDDYMERLEAAMSDLAAAGRFPDWE